MARTVFYCQVIGTALVAPLLASTTYLQQAAASERVRFDSAAVKSVLTEFQRRRAEASGQKIEPTPGDTIESYIVKPTGAGPFPVVVYLHDCSGLSADVKAEMFDPGRQPAGESATSPDAFFTSKLVSWGYAVVMPDSFATRNVTETCTTSTRPKQGWDAYGALAYAQSQPWADAKRIGLVGLSSGYVWHVARQSDLDIVVTPTEPFKAIVALLYHANCGTAMKMTAPTLTINGGVLEPERCAVSVREATEGGPPITYVPVKGAYSSFITPTGELDQAAFRAWVGTTEANKTVEMVDSFLDQHVKSAGSH
jgi:dienelactone hydrolase